MLHSFNFASVYQNPIVKAYPIFQYALLLGYLATISQRVFNELNIGTEN